MSATPGYYADPAGSDELRYFDGTQWAATTTPSPPAAAVAVATPASPPGTATAPHAAVPAPATAPDARTSDLWTRPAVGSRAATIQGFAPRAGAPQGPGIRTAGTPNIGEPFYRRPRVLAAIAGVAAVAVLGAVFVPGLLSSKSDSTSSVAPAAKAPVTEHHLVLHTPATINGWPRSKALTSEFGLADAKRALADQSTQSVFAAYRGPVQTDGAFIGMWDTYVPPERRAVAIKQLLKGLSKHGIAVTPGAKGRFGGQSSCGTVVEYGTRLSVCAFADDYTLGMIALFGTGSTGVVDVMKVREQVEQIADGPAPETGSTGDRYAKRDAQTVAKSVQSYYVDGTGPLAATTDIDRWVLTQSNDTTFDSGTLSAGDSVDASTYIRSANDWCVAVSNTDRSVWNVSSANGLLKGTCTASTVGGDSTPGRDGVAA